MNKMRRAPIRTAVMGLIALAAAFGSPATSFAADGSATSEQQVKAQSAAQQLDRLITENYAYLDDLPGGKLPTSSILDAQRDSVRDENTLLRYVENRLASLADHHANAGSSFRDSWALVPTYADLWIIVKGDLSGSARAVTLSSLYALPQPSRPDVSVRQSGNTTMIRFNNSLGEQSTIAAFDAAMTHVPFRDTLVLDLRDTPSGGNTSVARAIMGWFVRNPTAYQIHNAPAELRQTGIARQWVEQVLPRAGKFRPRLPIVLVGRWTGSMGEGLAIGFDAMSARVEGGPMAQLRGAIETLRVGDSDLTIQLPTERLLTVRGQPREQWAPKHPISLP